jgi:serine/threonine protein kinase
MVFPMCKNGDLTSLLHSQRQVLDEAIEFKIEIMLQMLLSVSHLHNSEYVAHGDIKPDNFVVADDLRNLSLIDFAHATCVDEVTGYYHGTSCFNPPELESREEHLVAKSDIFQLGVAFSCVLSKEYLWERTCTEDEAYLQFMDTWDQEAYLSYLLSSSPSNYQGVLEMIVKCLHPDPNHRPSSEDLLFEPIF